MEINKESIIQAFFLAIIMTATFFLISKPHLEEISTKDELTRTTDKNLDDKTAKAYAQMCPIKELSPQGIQAQVDCVLQATERIYHYTPDEERKKIRTPSQYAILGGNCRDSAVFYATIFKNLNYTIKFQFPVPKHTSIIINKKIDDHTYKYCVIEGNTAKCWGIII